ncbi:MAG: hypothetical protein ACLQU4_16995, partial [Limisphaerales bacterium]
GTDTQGRGLQSQTNGQVASMAVGLRSKGFLRNGKMEQCKKKYEISEKIGYLSPFQTNLWAQFPKNLILQRSLKTVEGSCCTQFSSLKTRGQ